MHYLKKLASEVHLAPQGPKRLLQLAPQITMLWTLFEDLLNLMKVLDSVIHCLFFFKESPT